jgi:pimeloyl-ACP methyl ester carboxylesterase
LRRAVGDRRLNYWGISYGTFLGATYANLFPRRVRAMILDGNLNPRAYVQRQLRANEGTFLSTDLRQHSDQGAARTLRAFLNLCGRADTAHCAFSAHSPAATRAKYAALLRRLRQHPARAKVSYAALVSDTANALYQTGEWPGEAMQLQNVWTTGTTRGSPPARDPFPIPQPLGEVPAAASAGGTLQLPGQVFAIRCSESPNPRLVAFPSLGRLAYQRSGPVGPWWSWQSLLCGNWPATAADRYAGPWDRRTANPLLVIGNTHDPATPYRGALAMSRQLARARLLTVDGYGHTALLNPSACANAYASDYLITKALPAKGTRCEQNTAPFGGTP